MLIRDVFKLSNFPPDWKKQTFLPKTKTICYHSEKRASRVIGVVNGVVSHDEHLTDELLRATPMRYGIKLAARAIRKAHWCLAIKLCNGIPPVIPYPD